MDFDDNEVFETFEKEFNRKESSKRPGNRFPSWIVPLMIVLAGVVYFGTQLGRFRPAVPTPTVDFAAIQSEEPFGAFSDGTETPETPSEPGLTGANEAVIFEPTPVPTDSPSFIDRFKRLFARATAEAPTSDTPDEPAPASGSEPRTETTDGRQSVTAGIAAATELPGASGSEPQTETTDGRQPVTAGIAAATELPGASGSEPRTETTDGRQPVTAGIAAATELPGASGSEPAISDPAAGEEPAPDTSADSNVVVLRAPSASPVATGIEQPAVQTSDSRTAAEPSATITIEIPLPSETLEIKAAQTETVQPPVNDTPIPTLTPVPTDEPGFFQRVGAFFFGPEATATAEAPLPTEIVVNLDGSETIVLSTATPTPAPTDEPGFFQRVGWFFFGAPTDVPTAEPTVEIVIPTVDRSDEAETEAPATEPAGGVGPKQAQGSGPVIDEPMLFPPGPTEPFYLPTSDIANPPTLVPQNFRPPANPTSSGIGLPLITQIAPTRPFSNLPTVRPTPIQPFNPTQPNVSIPIFRATPTVDPGGYLYPTSAWQNQPPLYEPAGLLPTALPDTGVGDNADMPQKVIAFIVLIALIIAVRVIRRRAQK